MNYPEKLGVFVYPMLPVSLDFSFLIAPFGFLYRLFQNVFDMLVFFLLAGVFTI
jgi:hypothetical protein